MGATCSGPEAGECVCGQCRCRQEVNPEVSLSPHHISLPSTSQSLVGQYTCVLSSVVFSAREYDCAYSKYVCMYMHTYVHACVNFSQKIKEHCNILILGIVHL